MELQRIAQLRKVIQERDALFELWKKEPYSFLAKYDNLKREPGKAEYEEVRDLANGLQVWMTKKMAEARRLEMEKLQDENLKVDITLT